MHLVFFLAVVKILTAKTSRDHLYTAVIAFLELIAAAILSNNFNFFLFLTLYLIFGIAALTSGEIRRSMAKAPSTARTGLRRFHPRLAVLAVTVTAGILILTAGLFFLLPRTADAAFSRLISHRMHLPGFSNQVNLGEIGEIKTSSRPVMHIRVYGEFPAGLKWRGESLPDFDGKRWFNPNRERRPVEVVHGEAELVAPGDRSPGHRLNYEVQYDDLDTDALFFAGTPDTVVLHSPRLYRTDGGGIRLGQPPPPGFHYDAYSLLEERPETATPLYPVPLLPLASRERYLQLPQIDPRIPALAHRFTRGARIGPGEGARDRSGPALGVRLHARTSQPRAGGPAGGVSVRAPQGPLRILRLGHDRDAADAGHPGAAGGGLPERRIQPDHGAVAGARLRRPHLGGSLDSRPRLDHFRPDPARPQPSVIRLVLPRSGCTWTRPTHSGSSGWWAMTPGNRGRWRTASSRAYAAPASAGST